MPRSQAVIFKEPFTRGVISAIRDTIFSRRHHTECDEYFLRTRKNPSVLATQFQVDFKLPLALESIACDCMLRCLLPPLRI